MNIKWNKTFPDKLEFLGHKIIIGMVLWIIASIAIQYQRHVINHLKNPLLNLILYLIPFLCLVWFSIVSSKHNQWKPFGSNSDIIGKIIIVVVALILWFTIGILNVVI